jgi:hypothetical protein
MENDDMTMVMMMMKRMTTLEAMMTMALENRVRPAEDTVGPAGGLWCDEVAVEGHGQAGCRY